MKYFIRVSEGAEDTCFIDFCKRNKLTPTYIDCAWGTETLTYLYTLMVSPKAITALKLSMSLQIAESI
jgi:hypothetical protein